MALKVFKCAGGVCVGFAAGYVASEWAKQGSVHAELTYTSKEAVASSEHPALRKAFLFPEEIAGQSHLGGAYKWLELKAAFRTKDFHVPRVLNAGIATFDGVYSEDEAINIIKGMAATGFGTNENGEATDVKLKDGRVLEADIVVVGVGGKPLTTLFKGQVVEEKGGIKLYGDNVGVTVIFGDSSPPSPTHKLYWIKGGTVAVAFLGSGTPEENKALAKVASVQPAADSLD